MLNKLVKCTQCRLEKNETEFHKDSKKSNGLRSNCKKCENLRTSRYCKKNKERRNEYQNKKYHERMKSDPSFVLLRRYRLRTSKLFRYKDFTKGKSAIKYLGCSREEFVKYFESLFTEGMTWEAVYSGKIHIDHIIPVSTAETEEDLIRLSHYTNLQPLWAEENLKKGNNVHINITKS